MRAHAACVIVLVIGALSSTQPAAAQTLGLIQGRVSDVSGAVLPGASVTVSHEQTGLIRSVVTNEQGLYRVPALNPGSYSVRVELAGFRPVARPAVVGAAETVTVDATLEMATVTETVEVRADAPLVNTSNAEIGQTVDARRVNELPLNGRDFTRLAMLTPGAVQWTGSMAAVSFNGGDALSNNFMLDGIDATRIDNPVIANGTERGARLQTAGVESIQEVRVLTTNYAAEYGRAASGVVNVITKSGTNTFRGSAYLFVRDDALDARNFFDVWDPATGRDKPRFELQQFGGSLGGPIRRDRVFFFGNYEGSRKALGSTVTGTVPSASFRLRADQAIEPLLRPIPLPTSATSNPDAGSVAVVGVNHVTENISSGRVDIRPTDGDTFYVRYNIQDSKVAGDLSAIRPLAFASQVQLVPIQTQSLAVSWVRTLSRNAVNEAKFGLNRFDHLIAQDDAVPGVTIPTTVVTGMTVQPGGEYDWGGLNRSYEFVDALLWFRGVHALKTGVNLRYVAVDIFNEPIATITYASMDAFARNQALQYRSTADMPMTYVRGWAFSGFLQDDIRAQPRLTFNLGLRYDFSTPWDDREGRLRNFDLARMQFDDPGVPLYDADANNLAPRVGGTYDLTGRGRTILRGGYGVYYAVYPANAAYQVLYANLPGSVFISRLTEPDLKYPVEASGISEVPPSPRAHDKHRRDAYAHQWNVNLQQHLARSMSVQIGYVGNRSLANDRYRPANLIDPATRQRPDPRYSQIVVVESSGRATYHALQLAFARPLAQGWQLNASYVYSKRMDDVAWPQNPDRWDLEWAPGDRDVPHSLTVNGLYELPFGPGRRWGGETTGLAAKLLEGWQLTGLAIARSGVPYTVTLGTFTMSGTGWTTNQRPDAVPGAASPDPSGATGWLNPAAYALPQAGTYGNLARNSARGPRFFQIDASLLKNTQVGRRSVVQIRLEVFNVLNTVNFALPSNNWRATSTFGQIFSTFGRTESVGTARQIQFAVRVTF